MFSAQTWTRRSSDTLDRLERAEPLSDHERPRIEGRLNFDFHTVRDAVVAFVPAGQDKTFLVAAVAAVPLIVAARGCC